MVLFNCVCRKSRWFAVTHRLCSSNVCKSLQKSLSIITPSDKHAKEVFDYLKNNEAAHLFKSIPSEYFKKKITRYILINPSIAKKVSRALKFYLNGSYVLESDPGYGLLSKELVRTVSYLRLYEENIFLRSNLRELLGKYSKKIEILDSSLQSIHKLQLEYDFNDRSRMALLFGDIPSDTRLNIIVIVPSKRFITGWIEHIINRRYFTRFKQLDFYFFMPPSIFTRLRATPQNDYQARYQRLSVLSQLLFDIKLLINDIPRKAFLPWPKRTTKKQKIYDVEKYENDEEIMYLVKLSLNQERAVYLQDENLYKCFFFFVSQNLTGNKRMVPYFEKIIPGSGVRIIMMGFNIYSTFSELNPDEMFSLFVQFCKWPEFKSSSFYTLWSNQMKSHDNEESEQNITDPLQTHHDGDDNDDDAFLIKK